MPAALLHRAATLLRSPYLCNWDHAVAHALARLLEATASGIEAFAEKDPGHSYDHLFRPEIAVTLALLRSFGHTCGDQPDRPCSSCALRVPTPEEAP